MTSDSGQIHRDLQTALLRLHASGPEGFEGLVRDAYREATGISLRLQKSARQDGADAVGSDRGTEIVWAIEAKRYGNSTELRLPDLKTKLIDAATRESNPVEFWVLAASREVSGDDVAALRRLGDQHGLGVEVLDWRSGGDLLASLPLLLRLAPESVRRHLGGAS